MLWYFIRFFRETFCKIFLSNSLRFLYATMFSPLDSSYVAVPIACDALNAQAVAVREYHYLTVQVMAIKEDKSFTRTQIGFRSLLQGKGRGVFVSTASCLSNVLNYFIQLSKNDWKKKIVFPIYRVGKEEKRNQNPKLFPLLVQMERFILAINGWFSPFSLLSVQQTSIC